MTLVAINKESNVNTPFDVEQIRADFPAVSYTHLTLPTILLV